MVKDIIGPELVDVPDFCIIISAIWVVAVFIKRGSIKDIINIT